VRFHDLHLKIAHDIATHGQSVMGVASQPSFSYTIGNHGRGLPELIVVGMNPLDACMVLNALGRMQRICGEALLGDVSLGKGAAALRLRFVSDELLVKDEYTYQVFVHYMTEDYRVTQVLIPDKAGKFPGDPECAEPYRRARIL
jgi:hypothetical protein